MNKTNCLIIEAIGARIDKIIKAYPDILSENKGLANSLDWIKEDINDVLNENFSKDE